MSAAVSPTKFGSTILTFGSEVSRVQPARFRFGKTFLLPTGSPCAFGSFFSQSGFPSRPNVSFSSAFAVRAQDPKASPEIDVVYSTIHISEPATTSHEGGSPNSGSELSGVSFSTEMPDYSQGRTTTGQMFGRGRSDRAADVFIHPSAVVHADAILMEGVEIGPFCTVGPKAKIGKRTKMEAGSHVRGKTEIGEGCVIQSGAVVGSDIPGETIIGSYNTIGYHAVVGVKCQDLKYKEGSECFLVVGDSNDVREHSQIHRSSKPTDITVIGNGNLIMGSCHIAHDCKVGDRNILANSTLLAGHVTLEDFVHTGGAVAVHQFCRIGAYSFLAGGSMVVRDVPAFVMVAGDRAELRGLNLEGMRRNGFTAEQVKALRKAYQRLFMSSPSLHPSQQEGASSNDEQSSPSAPSVLAGNSLTSLEQRIDELEQNAELMHEPAVKRLVDSVKGSLSEGRRGICKFKHWDAVE